MNGLITALIIPFAGTVLGAAFVFLMRDRMKGNLQRTLLGFASGVMVAAAVWSLLIPSISMPLRAEGNSRLRSFAVGALSGLVEPIGSIAIILLASTLQPLLPYLLAFAAGAMLYVVVEELIPEASHGEHSNLGTIGFAVSFVLMMVLDVVLG